MIGLDSRRSITPWKAAYAAGDVRYGCLRPKSGLWKFSGGSSALTQEILSSRELHKFFRRVFEFAFSPDSRRTFSGCFPNQFPSHRPCYVYLSLPRSGHVSSSRLARSQPGRSHGVTLLFLRPKVSHRCLNRFNPFPGLVSCARSIVKSRPIFARQLRALVITVRRRWANQARQTDGQRLRPTG